MSFDATASNAEKWSGLRPLSPDTLPIIGRPRTQSGVILPTGHGMLGISLGPATGEAVPLWSLVPRPPSIYGRIALNDSRNLQPDAQEEPMAHTLRIGQIGIAHTHSAKAVQWKSLPVLRRLDAEFVGVHGPNPEMLVETCG